MEPAVRLDHDIDPLVDHVRPATIWLGIACFFVGAIGTGATLAATQAGAAGPHPAAGLALLSLGIGYIGVGLVAPPTESPYDPEIDLPAWGRAIVAGLAGVCLVAGLLAVTVAL